MKTAFYTQPLNPPSQEDTTEDVSAFALVSVDKLQQRSARLS
jgi:hypothetical protein